MVASEIVKFEYKPSKSMWCDALNKCISYPQFMMHIEPMMGPQERRKIQEVLMAARTKNCYQRGPPKNAQNALLMQFWIRNWINGLAAVKKPKSNQ